MGTDTFWSVVGVTVVAIVVGALIALVALVASWLALVLMVWLGRPSQFGDTSPARALSRAGNTSWPQALEDARP